MMTRAEAQCRSWSSAQAWSGLRSRAPRRCAGHDVTVAEATGGIANGVSSRNSEVIHAGLYYPTGTLRAVHCVRGRRMLYEFCASHGVGHRKCGKLVVATNAGRACEGRDDHGARPRSTASKASS